MTQHTKRSTASGNTDTNRSRGCWNREAYVRHRDYSPTLGRFIERDPIGFDAGDNNWYRFVANGPTWKTDPSGLAYREVTCTFGDKTRLWSQTIAARTPEAAMQACTRIATGWGLGMAWKVWNAREGALHAGQHQDHGGTYESDYADLRVTCVGCADKTQAIINEKKCRDGIALRAAKLQMAQNLTGLGEGIFGTVLGGAGSVVIAAGTNPVGGAVLLAGGILITLKGGYDVYVTTEIAQAAWAAAVRYCDCAKIVI